MRDGDPLVVRRTVAVVSGPSRSSRKRTGASRRARRKLLHLTEATARAHLDTGGAPVIPIRCVCGKRLAEVVTKCRTPPERWSTRDWSRLPYYEPIEGAWLERWATELQLRNRKGIAGETHLEGRWRVSCPRCKARHSGTTAQLVTLVSRPSSALAGEVVLSGPNLGAIPPGGAERLEEYWTGRTSPPPSQRMFKRPPRPGLRPWE